MARNGKLARFTKYVELGKTNTIVVSLGIGSAYRNLVR